MLFSVIVPIYNVEKYLKQCVDSILNQTFKDFELILVDDGSKDNCPLICDEYAEKDNRVTVIHKPNGGLVSARQAGAKIAKGDYVVAVDGDDFVADDMLSVYNEILLKKKYDIVCCGYFDYTDDANIAEVKHKGYRKEYSRSLLEEELFNRLITSEEGNRFPPSVWAKAIKMDLYKRIQLQVPTAISIGEDSCVVYPCIYYADSMFISDKCVYYYRLNNASLTKQKKKAFSWEEVLLRAEHYKKFFPENIFGDQIARITAHSMFNVAVTEFYANRYKLAKRIIKEKLKDKNIKAYLKQAVFKNNSREKLSLYCLKHKLYFIIYLYSRLK